MKTMDKISIIIPCYNDAEYIETAIDSAIKQSWSNKEIIVIDDGSNTQTKAVLKKLEHKIDILVSQENKGVSAARNNGINEASGNYILTLDSDDYFEPRFCEKAMQVFKNKPGVKVVTCYAKWFKSAANFSLYKPEGGELENYLISNSALGNCLMKKTDIQNCGGYDEDLKDGYEDWELFIRIHKNGGFTHVIPEVLFSYRIRKDSRSVMAETKKYELLKYIYLKHTDLYKTYFEFFITEWLDSVKKSEAFKQKVMRGPEYKIGYHLLRPFRALGYFKK